MKKSTNEIVQRTCGRGIATAMATLQAAAASNQKGDLIAVGDGTNTIIGDSGNDLVLTGTGNDTRANAQRMRPRMCIRAAANDASMRLAA